jgi:hypothetical protein
MCAPTSTTSSPHRTVSHHRRALGPRHGPGKPPKLTDAELVCLAVAQALLGARSERHWLRFARTRLGHRFSYLPQQAGYNNRLRAAAHLVALAIRHLAQHSPSWGDGFRLLDATPLPCGASRETVKRSALIASRSDRPSKACSTITVATTSAGTEGWPPPCRATSANSSGGNS